MVGLEVALHLAVEVPQWVHGEVEGVLFGVHQIVVDINGAGSVLLGVEAKPFFDTFEDVEVGLRWTVQRHFVLRRRCSASRRG